MRINAKKTIQVNIMIFGSDKETMIDYIDPRWQSKCMPNLKNIVVESNHK